MRRLEDAPLHTVNILIDDVETEPVQKFELYSDAITNIVKNSDPKFSIGIYGEWGTGKTTLMRLIEEKLKGFLFSWENVAGNNTESIKIKEFLKHAL